MKKIAFSLLAVVAAVVVVLVAQKRPHEISVLPLPVSVQASGDEFKLSASTGFLAEGAGEAGRIAADLEAEFAARTGLEFTEPQQEGKNILFVLEDGDENGSEAYHISVTKDQVVVKAEAPAGLYYAGRTLGQLLFQQGRSWVLPTCEIADAPRFAYRGVMLDVTRHFFTVEDVKRFIDRIADLKLNTLHLHLTDDQGWRIEIKSWPELTAVGAACEVGEGDGGFYTQEEFKEIVRYAAEHYVTVIPEVDMPGHTNAALVSYAELNADGKKKEPYRGIKVGFSTLDTQKEATYRFVDDVVREISALYPAEYFHVGGDESRVTEEEDYIYFMNRVKPIVNKYGKKLIGWEEVANAAVSSGDVIQIWKDRQNIDLAFSKGAKVLISPAEHAYLDMQYDSTSRIGLHWKGYVELDRAYNWDPAEVASVEGDEQIFGVESALWTETVENFDDISYLTFPRLAGHAEIGWSPRESRDWDGYTKRLVRYAPRLEAAGVAFYRSPLIEWN